MFLIFSAFYGGQIGPSLDGVVDTKGALFVQRKMSEPSFDNAGTLMPNLRLKPEQVTALIAYLATLQRGSPRVIEGT